MDRGGRRCVAGAPGVGSPSWQDPPTHDRFSLPHPRRAGYSLESSSIRFARRDSSSRSLLTFRPVEQRRPRLPPHRPRASLVRCPETALTHRVRPNDSEKCLPVADVCCCADTLDEASSSGSSNAVAGPSGSASRAYPPPNGQGGPSPSTSSRTPKRTLSSATSSSDPENDTSVSPAPKRPRPSEDANATPPPPFQLTPVPVAGAEIPVGSMMPAALANFSEAMSALARMRSRRESGAGDGA